MNIIEIIIASFALAADAFAVSICKGLSYKKINLKSCLRIGLFFGMFQGLMPLLGYFFGSVFEKYIEAIDHWIAFGLLLYIGISMIKDAYKKEEIKDDDSLKNIIILSIATSIDALTYGIAYYYGYGENNMILAFTSIGIITFILSSLGVYIGNKFGNKFEKTSRIIGGIVLIALGIKILIEHIL